MKKILNLSRLQTSLFRMVGFLAFLFLGVGVNAALPVSPNTWAEINDNPENYSGALALEMDEPLYNAIYDVYATTGSPKLDGDENGWISIIEASSWSGKTIDLDNKDLTGSTRGIGYFENITQINLTSNKLTGRIPSEIGNMTKLQYLYLFANQLSGPLPPEIGNLTALKALALSYNKLSGNLPDEIGNLVNLTSFVIPENRFNGVIPQSIGNLINLTNFNIANNLFSGQLPSLSAIPPSIAVVIQYNLHLANLNGKASNWSSYSDWKTATNPQNDLNISSTSTQYALKIPQGSGAMILNHDIDNNGMADLNLTSAGGSRPAYNIDVNGDKKADLNIVIDQYFIETGDPLVFNQAKAITTTSDGFLGWVRPDFDYVAGMTKADFEVSPEYPYYIIAKTDGALTDGMGTPPFILELNKQVGETILNIDTNNDGIPDENIDINGDNVPDYNVKGTPPTPPTNPTVPTSSGGGGGGTSLKADSCPAGDLSPSYYDGTCGTTAALAPLVAAKVNVLRSLIRLIYITATEKEKTLVHDIITSCSQTNKKEIIKLACQDLVANRDF